MLFSSPVFLFLFLPVLLALYAVCPQRGKNVLLLAASLLFYAWGEPLLILVMFASIGMNYGFGLWVERARSATGRHIAISAAVVGNLALLGYFKYAGFLIQNLNVLLAAVGLPELGSTYVVMPIGISFYTFQAMSYVIDVYRGETRAQKNPIVMALYIALFPQLIAGPIVRYVDVAAQMAQRRVTLAGFSSGIQRFIIGLGKKMLLANAAASVADSIFDIPSHQLSLTVAWLGIVCYAVQIYFDFAGYSDMAIGLGRMFGFEFLENFNYPYISRSITEFWRRWHISLSTWFRDYVYIPLGGNRRGPARTYANLLIVFLLCGLWHGASWNFVIWGAFHGAFLIIERGAVGRWLARAWGPVQHLYALVVVLVGWVFFRAETFPMALGYLGAMLGLNGLSSVEYPLALFLDSGVIVALLAGALASTPIVPWLVRRYEQQTVRTLDAWRQTALATGWELSRLAGLTLIFVGSAANMVASTYNPFIYFRF
ncbi:MAG: MBOAT family protein [Planctomycetes bacterium]|nr:MBOAT family protein [Planctomycetota bacterium]